MCCKLYTSSLDFGDSERKLRCTPSPHLHRKQRSHIRRILTEAWALIDLGRFPQLGLEMCEAQGGGIALGAHRWRRGRQWIHSQKRSPHPSLFSLSNQECLPELLTGASASTESVQETPASPCIHLQGWNSVEAVPVHVPPYSITHHQRGTTKGSPGDLQ